MSVPGVRLLLQQTPVAALSLRTINDGCSPSPQPPAAVSVTPTTRNPRPSRKMVSATQSHSKLSAKAKGKQRESPATGPAGATAKTTSKPSTPSKADTTSSIKHEQEQAKATKKPTKKPEKSKVRRVHVSGLPAISEDEVRSRFKSFGNVLKVDGLGKMDGNGEYLRKAQLFAPTDSLTSRCLACAGAESTKTRMESVLS